MRIWILSLLAIVVNSSTNVWAEPVTLSALPSRTGGVSASTEQRCAEALASKVVRLTGMRIVLVDASKSLYSFAPNGDSTYYYFRARNLGGEEFNGYFSFNTLKGKRIAADGKTVLSSYRCDIDERAALAIQMRNSDGVMIFQSTGLAQGSQAASASQFLNDDERAAYNMRTDSLQDRRGSPLDRLPRMHRDGLVDTL